MFIIDKPDGTKVKLDYLFVFIGLWSVFPIDTQSGLHNIREIKMVNRAKSVFNIRKEQESSNNLKINTICDNISENL